jgi:hypothetical protein
MLGKKISEVESLCKDGNSGRCLKGKTREELGGELGPLVEKLEAPEMDSKVGDAEWIRQCATCQVRAQQAQNDSPSVHPAKESPPSRTGSSAHILWELGSYFLL